MQEEDLTAARELSMKLRELVANRTVQGAASNVMKEAAAMLDDAVRYIEEEFGQDRASMEEFVTEMMLRKSSTEPQDITAAVRAWKAIRAASQEYSPGAEPSAPSGASSGH